VFSHLSPDIIRHLNLSRVDSIDDLQPLTEENKGSHILGLDRPSSCQDGILEIVSVRGTFHLGQIRVGLSNATRICQASEVKIIIKKKVAIQIDGEPWRQSACTMTITRKKDPAVMLHRSADESGGVETEMAKLLDWAEERKIINRNVHGILMKEFSRRIENKTRQRRVKSQDNLMLSLKRAMLSGGGGATQGAFPGTLSF
jgi:Diacylglycerol kinase accessory domain